MMMNEKMKYSRFIALRSKSSRENEICMVITHNPLTGEFYRGTKTYYAILMKCFSSVTYVASHIKYVHICEP